MYLHNSLHTYVPHSYEQILDVPDITSVLYDIPSSTLALPLVQMNCYCTQSFADQ